MRRMKAGIIPNVVASVPRMQMVITAHTQLVCTRNSNYTQYFLLRVDASGKQFVVSCVNVFHVFVDDALVIVSPPCEVLCAAMRLLVSVSALTRAHVNAHDNVCDTVGEAS